MSLRLASRLSAVQPSATIAATARAAEMRAAGHQVLGLTAGEPDFATPAHIQAAAQAAMAAGETKYTAVDGTPLLKEAIQDKFRRENGLDYALDEIIAGTGAKQVIFNALMALVEPGDEVIIPTPAWVSYADIVRLAGGVPVFLPTAPETGFRLDPKALAEAITPATRVCMLNSPNNPTGALLPEATLSEIGQVLEKSPRVFTITDDIYEHLIYTDTAFASLAAVCPGIKERVLTVNGVSKAYAMTGWRLGYGAGPAPLIAAMKTLQSQSTTGPSSISQAAAAAALMGGLHETEAMRSVFQTRRDRMVHALSAVNGLSVFRPDGAFYLFIGLAGLIGGRTPDGKTLETEAEIVDHIIASAGVVGVGGAGFGMSPYIRLSFAAADDVLELAAERLTKCCNSIRMD